MSFTHKLVLYGLLGFLGLSLLIPGLIELLKPKIGSSGLSAETLDAQNHLRAVSAMIAALGAIALWACFDLEHQRRLVLALGVVMAFLAIGRVYSLIVDGLPGPVSLAYLAIESLMAWVFLAWPPP